MKLWLKRYLIRVLIINFFSLFYLIQTPVFDSGFFSIQSIFYSINIYLLYLFIFLEAKSSFFSIYGLDFSFYKLIINNLGNLNLKYIFYIAFQNINIFYFLFFSLGCLLFIEKINYNFIFKKDSLNAEKKFFASILFIVFILTSFNPSNTHLTLIERYKNLTNTWTPNDLVLNEDKYISQYIENNFFRNDNWFNTIKYTYLYFDSNSSGEKKISQFEKDLKFKSFRNFGEIITKNKYDNIYVIINESYPSFRNKKLKENLLEKIKIGNDDLIIQNFKKKWNRTLTTQGAEMEFFCNKDVNFEKYIVSELKNFIEENNCWINSMKDKNLIYIHSYEESFFNRSRYKSFFNKTFFKKELSDLNFEICNQKYSGICDHTILDNMNKIIEDKKNNFVIFLTVNNHIPTSKFYEKPFINCKENFPLNLNKQFCHIYNNQMLFNESISKLINRMNKNDLLVFFSDTPPMFKSKRRVHFEDLINVYFFSNKQI